MNDNIKAYLQPAFLLCIIILATAGGAMSYVIEKFEIYFVHEPLPLKKSLDLLSEKDLAPYEVVSKRKIENEDVVKELGTKDYIQWILENPNVDTKSTVRKCMLLITYYEQPDRIPHVPDECYVGTGSQKLEAENLIINLSNEGKDQQIPARCVVFATSTNNFLGASSKFPIMYLFSVNGEYKGNRESARIALNKNIRGMYSYFSKVEWKFFNTGFGTMVYPSKKEAIEASKPLLSAILPILEKEHWPDMLTNTVNKPSEVNN